MNIITSGHVLPVTVKTDCSVVVPYTSTESSDWSYTVMNPSIQVFLQVDLLCCMVTTSIWGSLIFKGHFHNLRTE